ncbi:MAG: hypothetical protein ACREEP_17345, partial [Dongiaceae bacterium]
MRPWRKARMSTSRAIWPRASRSNSLAHCPELAETQFMRNFGQACSARMKNSGMEIEITAPRNVRDVIASMGRTEDVRFSPSNRRLAVAIFDRNKIAVFDIDITVSGTATEVTLNRVRKFFRHA